MPSQRYKVEGTVTIQFEAELSADDIGFFDDDEAQSAIEDHIEGDPVEFLNEHSHITYREDSVDIESCEEMGPDWDGELKKVVTKANAETLRDIVTALPDDAKEAIVKAIKKQQKDED